MRVHTEEIRFSTEGREQVVLLTRHVEHVVERSGIGEGLCLVYAPHATGILIANENEPGLVRDIVSRVKSLFPPNAPYEHNRIDDNAHAHLASVFTGHFLVFPVINARLVRGTWQEVMFVELDGPRPQRRIIVVVLGM